MEIVFDEYLPRWNYTAVPFLKACSLYSCLISIRDNIKEIK